MKAIVTAMSLVLVLLLSAQAALAAEYAGVLPWSSGSFKTAEARLVKLNFKLERGKWYAYSTGGASRLKFALKGSATKTGTLKKSQIYSGVLCQTRYDIICTPLSTGAYMRTSYGYMVACADGSSAYEWYKGRLRRVR